MFVLNCDIKIGDVSFQSVHDITIKRSLYDLSATAVIKLPGTSVLKQGDGQAVRKKTADVIKPEDKVVIRLGYNNRLETEFVGYVKHLNYKMPLAVECEDEFARTRIDGFFNEKEATLEQCIKKILPEIKIGYCPDLTLRNFKVNHESGSSVLERIKKEYGLDVFFDVNGNLFVGRPKDEEGERVKYRLRHNVISDQDLKYQFAENVKLKVKAICNLKDGTKKEAEAGTDGGETRTRYFYDVENESELKSLAETEVKRYSFDGYRGKMQTFLQPYALPGMIAEIDDPDYQKFSGSYLIESTETTFSTSGARRVLEIGIKI